VKILIVRFSSIGDVVLTTPIIRAIKEQRPEIDIHFITKMPFKSIVANHPCLDNVHVFKKSVKECLPELRAEKFDLIIDLHHNIRSILLSLYLGVRTYRFQKLNLRKWLLVRFKWRLMPDIHVVDRYFGTLAQLGIHNKGKRGELFLSPDDYVNTYKTFGHLPGTYLTVAVGAQYATKRMPVDVLVRILNQNAHPVVLCGGKEDASFAASVMKSLPDKKLFNACGLFSLMQSASIVKQSAVLITNDTGLMHIASCFGVPIVSVWGNTVPELGMYPYMPSSKDRYSIHQVNDLHCRPCSKIGFQSCPKGHFRCMNLQQTEDIEAQVKKFYALNK
jgi:ADP-heptose:LPS heptosyltransferase